MLSFQSLSIFAQSTIRPAQYPPRIPPPDLLLGCYMAKGPSYSAKTSEVDPATAHFMALMSMISYEDEEVVRAYGKALKFPYVKFLEKKVETEKTVLWRNILTGVQKRFIRADTQTVWFENDETIVIAFRGTTIDDVGRFREATDLFTDGLFWPTELNRFVRGDRISSRVHPGFYGALFVIWEDLLKEIKKPQSAKKKILLTGHSLGAGVATLAAFKLAGEQVEFMEQQGAGQGPQKIWSRPTLHLLYTFGSPKVGNETFVSLLNYLMEQQKADSIVVGPDDYLVQKTHYARFVHDNDIVARIPPDIQVLPEFLMRPIVDYEHLGNLNFFQYDYALKTGLEAAGAEKRVSSLLWTGAQTVEDHLMHNYLEATYRNSNGARPSGCI